jgi:hypothetical protein
MPEPPLRPSSLAATRRGLRLRYRLLLFPLARLILVLREVCLQDTAREIEADTIGGYANSLYDS